MIASDESAIAQMLELKARMAKEASIYGGRVETCDRAISLLRERSALCDRRLEGIRRVLNMLAVDLLSSRIAEQLPHDLSADILEHLAKLEALEAQTEELSRQIEAVKTYDD